MTDLSSVREQLRSAQARDEEIWAELWTALDGYEQARRDGDLTALRESLDVAERAEYALRGHCDAVGSLSG